MIVNSNGPQTDPCQNHACPGAYHLISNPGICFLVVSKVTSALQNVCTYLHRQWELVRYHAPLALWVDRNHGKFQSRPQPNQTRSHMNRKSGIGTYPPVKGLMLLEGDARPPNSYWVNTRLTLFWRILKMRPLGVGPLNCTLLRRASTKALPLASVQTTRSCLRRNIL